MTPDNAFRKLRRAWFREVLMEQGHPRESESVTAESGRDARNGENREEYDLQTESLLSGNDNWVVSPRCSADLYKGSGA